MLVSGIPPWLLVHTVTIERSLGVNANGPVFDAPVDVAAFVDPSRTRETGDETAERVARATIFVPLDTTVDTGDRITVNGRVSTVVEVLRRDGGGLPTPDHIEIRTE